jgi:TM2 domain-containing membrane protein YozV
MQNNSMNYPDLNDNPYSPHPDVAPYSKGVAFVLWLACCFGVFGIHRFYLGKVGTGVLYLFTFGLFGIGQFIDLLLIPGMVRKKNGQQRLQGLQHGVVRYLPPAGAPSIPRSGLAEVDGVETMRMKLLNAAAKHGGRLTVTQGVMETGKSFREVENALDQMAKSGYVDIDNEPQTGVVVYVFNQLVDLDSERKQ